MGLFSFGKKPTEIALPPAPEFNVGQLPTDLPKIDGQQLPDLPSLPDAGTFGLSSTSNIDSSLPSEFNFPPLPTVNADPFTALNPQSSGQSSASLSSLSSSVSQSNDMAAQYDAFLKLDATPASSTASQNTLNALPDFPSNPTQVKTEGLFMPTSGVSFQQPLERPTELKALDPKSSDPTYYIDTETLERLFPRDTDWKEPDWNNFDPYPEQKIEEPTEKDFSEIVMGETKSLPAFDDIEDSEKRPRTKTELFVRGAKFKAIYSEITNSTATVTHMRDSITTDRIAQEQLLCDENKLRMDAIQKKLVMIDHNIASR